MENHMWDTLALVLSSDPERIGCVRIHYDRDELVPGCNIMRERSFARERFPLPEIVVVSSTPLEIELRAYYEGEEDLGMDIKLHLDDDPEMWIKIGDQQEERQASLGLRLEEFGDSVEDGEDTEDVGYDDDGRYDAWA